MKNLMNKIRKSNKGFTMVELIIVIAIIAVLTAVIAPQYLKYVEKSKIAADEDLISRVYSAMQVALVDDDYALVEGDKIVISSAGIVPTEKTDASKLVEAMTEYFGVDLSVADNQKVEVLETYTSATFEVKKTGDNLYIDQDIDK